MLKPARLILLCAAVLLAQAAQAASKPCDELKAEIATVENDKVGDAKLVGSCDGGTKKLTYVRK